MSQSDPSDEGGLAKAAAAAGISAWSVNLAARTITLRGPIVEQLGLSGETLALAQWRKLASPQDRVEMDHASKAMTAGETAHAEYSLRKGAGGRLAVLVRGAVVARDDDGAASRLAGVIMATSRKSEEVRRLAVREQQLSDAVEAGLVGIWSFDFMTGEQSARGQVLDWMGQPRDADTVTQEAWRSVIHPEDQDRARAAHQSLRRGEPVEPLDYRMRAPGGWRWVRTYGAAVDHDSTGAPLRAAGVIIDIHAEHTYAEALDAERQRFTQVYHATPALLHSIDARGDSLMVSDYWVARMGWPREQVIGAPGWTFMEAASAVRLRDEVIPRTLATGWCENEPAIALTARGERLDLRLSAFVERDADGEPVAAHGVFSDVTDLAQARRTAEDHAAALERSNRELDRFAAIASHDLQEPLRKISAFAGLLQRNLGEGLDPASRQALDFLVDAAGRQRILIDDLLAYSRAANRVFQPKSIALGPVVSEVLASLDLQIEEAGAHMEIGELPAITGDRVLLGLMVRNLLSNALKYRKGPGVQITLAATLTEAGRAVLSVADDGIGIDPVFFEKIFEPFARLHEREAYSGTGIGLAICQQAVERMGGSINVESAPGEGARFVVDLPTAPSDP